MAGWKPRRGTDWVDLMTRVEETSLLRPSRGRLVAILVLAAMAMSTLDLGPLSGGGVNATVTSPR
jgi:hypothetical protein